MSETNTMPRESQEQNLAKLIVARAFRGSDGKFNWTTPILLGIAAIACAWALLKGGDVKALVQGSDTTQQPPALVAQQPQYQPQPAYVHASHQLPPGSPIPAQPVVNGMAQTVTHSFMVLSSGKATNKNLLFLNNKANYKEAGCFTVVVDLTACPEWANVPPAALKGKTVTATGLSGVYNGNPQLTVTRASDISVR